MSSTHRWGFLRGPHKTALLLSTALLSAALPVQAAAAPAASSVPQGCAGTLTWSAGALPPKYQHSWTLTLHPDATASFELTSAGTSVYRDDDFPTDPREVADLCHKVAALPLHPAILVGGHPLSWDLRTDEGSQLEGSSTFSSEYEATVKQAKKVISQERFDKAMAKREQLGA